MNFHKELVLENSSRGMKSALNVFLFGRGQGMKFFCLL